MYISIYECIQINLDCRPDRRFSAKLFFYIMLLMSYSTTTTTTTTTTLDRYLPRIYIFYSSIPID